VEFLNVHETSHFAIELLMLHVCQHVGLEVRVRECPALEFCYEDDGNKAVRNFCLLKLAQSNALSDHKVKRVPTLLVVIMVTIS
jgi:hypothetical protein